ncbi:hypothetical protein M426DRAFT_26053 [Hypoxylon sp. CI-4A]|nr:hypothetical protein M426DRAFT_26053 [Hypoxylon sp. CI-4A]
MSAPTARGPPFTKKDDVQGSDRAYCEKIMKKSLSMWASKLTLNERIEDDFWQQNFLGWNSATSPWRFPEARKELARFASVVGVLSEDLQVGKKTNDSDDSDEIAPSPRTPRKRTKVAAAFGTPKKKALKISQHRRKGAPVLMRPGLMNAINAISWELIDAAGSKVPSDKVKFPNAGPHDNGFCTEDQKRDAIVFYDASQTGWVGQFNHNLSIYLIRRYLFRAANPSHEESDKLQRWTEDDFKSFDLLLPVAKAFGAIFAPLPLTDHLLSNFPKGHV